MDRASSREIDEDLARWRGVRDVAALERVFDAAAPRLQLIAARLVGDGDAARDVVQRAFLVVVERPERWDPRRPAWPWLVGTVAREARAFRRRDLARASQDAAVAARSARPGTEAADPLATVAGRETIERVRQAIDRMSTADRQVLTLHLLHGLQPVEIAAALEQNGASVRSRLARGMKRLRQTLRRDGVAWSVAGLRLEGAAVEPGAAVRAVVLDAARRAAGRGAVPAAGGVAASWGLAVVALLLGVGGVWYGIERALAPIAPAHDRVGAVGRGPAGPEAGVDRPLGRDGFDGARRPAVAVEGSREEVVTTVIRVLDAAGNPAPGVLLRHEVAPRSGPGDAAVHEARTDAAGEVRIVDPAARRVGHGPNESRVVLHEPCVPPIPRELDLDAPPATLRPIRLPPTGRVRVRLVDQFAQPVERLKGGVLLVVDGGDGRPFVRPLSADPDGSKRPWTEIPDGVVEWPWCGLGERLLFVVGDPGIDPATRETEWQDGPSEAGEQVECVMSLMRLHELRARIVQPDGRPWGGAGMLMAWLDVGGRERLVDLLPTGDSGVRVIVPADVTPQDVRAVRLRMSWDPANDGDSVRVPLQLGRGPTHDLGTLRLATAPLVARGHVVDLAGRPIPTLRAFPKRVRVVAPGDTQWDGAVRFAGDGTFELRGDAEGVERFEIPSGLSPDDVRLPEPVRFAPGDLDVLVPVEPLARLEVGFAHPIGMPRHLDLSLEPFAGGEALQPEFLPQFEAERTVYRFERFTPGRWRVVARVPGTREPVWTSDWLDLTEARPHAPDDLRAIPLPNVSSIRVRWVDEAGRQLERDALGESMLFVRDAADPDLWHGRWFVGTETTVDHVDEVPDIVVRTPGHRPIRLRGPGSDVAIRPQPLPDRVPPPEGPTQTWRFRQPFGEDLVLSGRPFPESWFER